MAHTHSHVPHELPTGATEPDSINARSILGFAIGLTVVALISHLAMLLMFRVMSNQADVSDRTRLFPLAPIATEPRLPGDRDGLQPPDPRLQSDPKADLGDLRQLEEQALAGYGWVDRNNNLVRIPIDSAMKLTLQRGLPARTAAPEGAPLPMVQPGLTPGVPQGSRLSRDNPSRVWAAGHHAGGSGEEHAGGAAHGGAAEH